MSPSTHQVSEALCGALLAAMRSGPATQEGCDSILHRAGAALYSLLAAHPVDGRGRCRSCRGHRWRGRRRQVCLIFLETHYWLRQPSHIVQAHLVAEWGLDVATPRGTADPKITTGGQGA
jgi:hypothetical protein